MSSIRSQCSTTALVNWYRLLWNVSRERRASPTLIAAIVKVERDLFRLMHYNRRDDLSIMVCVMRVWALARVNCSETIEKVAFSDIEQEMSLRLRENAIAYLCSGPVPENLIPPLYRQAPPLGMEGVELTDEGILILFALWHGSLIDLVEKGPNLHIDSNREIECPSYTFADDDYRLLDRIMGMEQISIVSLFSFYSNPNPFTLIKHSGLDFTQQTKMASLLFDHEPLLYKENVLGRLLIVARVYKIPFLVNDEILFYFLSEDEKPALWIFYSLERKTCAWVENGKIRIQFDMQAQGDWVHDVHTIVAAAAKRSIGREAAMEEET